MTIFHSEDQPPEPGPGDTALTVAKAVMQAVPLVGSPAAELLNLIVTPPLQRRRDEWFTDLGERIRRLEIDKGIRLYDLRENAAFVDIAIQATQAAMRTSQAEKREALQNAVLNATSTTAPEVALQHVFVSLIDVFTEWHLRILRLFQGPRAWFLERKPDYKPADTMTRSPIDVLRDAYPEVAQHKELVALVWKELIARDLIANVDLNAMMSSNGALSKQTTVLGDQFLRFIQSPLEG
jgi:hypothetical protein